MRKTWCVPTMLAQEIEQETEWLGCGASRVP